MVRSTIRLAIEKLEADTQKILLSLTKLASGDYGLKSLENPTVMSAPLDAERLLFP